MFEINYGTYWSGGELRKLEALAKSGKSIKQIAAALGRSEGAVRQRLAILRTSYLFQYGTDDATLRSTAKDPKFNFYQGN